MQAQPPAIIETQDIKTAKCSVACKYLGFNLGEYSIQYQCCKCGALKEYDRITKPDILSLTPKIPSTTKLDED